jgi:oligopeptide/dipeptide ABC transporter ATP-binding protein
MAQPLLAVRGLVTEFEGEGGPTRAVDGVSFDLDRGAALGVVGESGSGKSTLALAIMGLIEPPGRIARGQIHFAGSDLLTLTPERLRRLRGRSLAMIFQEPLSALNPVFPVGEQVAEVLRRHLGIDRAAARRRVVELFERVGLPAPERQPTAYPHALSGGMRQRVCIAMALAGQPQLLIADEPTTALDAAVQLQLLELLDRLRRELELSLLLISHDLELVARICQQVAVLYAGQVVEQGPTDRVLVEPRHPYTAALLRALPDPGRPRQPLPALGSPGRDPRDEPGCRFAGRCSRLQPGCREGVLDLDPAGVRCRHPLGPAAPPADGAGH